MTTGILEGLMKHFLLFEHEKRLKRRSPHMGCDHRRILATYPVTRRFISLYTYYSTLFFNALSEIICGALWPPKLPRYPVLTTRMIKIVQSTNAFPSLYDMLFVIWNNRLEFYSSTKSGIIASIQVFKLLISGRFWITSDIKAIAIVEIRPESHIDWEYC